MPASGTFAEDYSISRARTGDAKINKLVLTGWSKNQATFTEQGRLYWIVTTGNVLELYRKEDKAAADLIATGSIADDLVTLTASNSSGITGSAEVIHTDGDESTGEIIISYANEDDLERALKNSKAFFDKTQKWADEPRFEAAFKEAKNELDDWIVGKLSTRLQLRKSLDYDLAGLAQPRQFSRIHALLTASHLLAAQGTLRADYAIMAKDKRDAARDRFKGIIILLDQFNDDTIEDKVSGASTTLTRG